MTTRNFRIVGFWLLISLIFAAVPVRAQSQGETSNTAPVTIYVTVLGPKFTPPPAVSKDDVIAYTHKTKLDVTSWIPAQGDKANLQLAIVIDELLPTSLGLQFNDIKNFINSQPRTTAIGLFYAANGIVEPVSQFNTDHEAVAKSLRLPLGRFAAYTSVYLSLLDLFKRWPVTPNTRREVFVVADGIDRFRGDIPESPDLDEVIKKAQEGDIMIHSLYAAGADRVAHNTWRVTLGQGNLANMADSTGGEAFTEALVTPVSFAPFLGNLDMILRNQYWLGLSVSRGKKPKGELRPFRVGTELRNVEISFPRMIPVPGTEK